MKSRLQRSSTALLVAMVGLSLVFSAGCVGSKKKKAKEATELPADKDGEKSSEGDKVSDAGTDSGSGTSDIASAPKDSGSSGDQFASNPPPKDDLGAAPAGGSGSFEGLESRHGAPSIGAEDQSLALAPAEKAPAPEEEVAQAPVKKTKKGKGKKKKKAGMEPPIETADADAAAADDAGGAADGANSYTVKKGDSLSKIAKSHGVKLKALLTTNGMKMEDAAKLKVGTKLKIPAGKAG